MLRKVTSIDRSMIGSSRWRRVPRARSSASQGRLTVSARLARRLIAPPVALAELTFGFLWNFRPARLPPQAILDRFIGRRAQHGKGTDEPHRRSDDQTAAGRGQEQHGAERPNQRADARGPVPLHQLEARARTTRRERWLDPGKIFWPLVDVDPILDLGNPSYGANMADQCCRFVRRDGAFQDRGGTVGVHLDESGEA